MARKPSAEFQPSFSRMPNRPASGDSDRGLTEINVTPPTIGDAAQQINNVGSSASGIRKPKA